MSDTEIEDEMATLFQAGQSLPARIQRVKWLASVGRYNEALRIVKQLERLGVDEAELHDLHARIAEQKSLDTGIDASQTVNPMQLGQLGQMGQSFLCRGYYGYNGYYGYYHPLTPLGLAGYGALATLGGGFLTVQMFLYNVSRLHASATSYAAPRGPFTTVGPLFTVTVVGIAMLIGAWFWWRQDGNASSGFY